MDYTINNDVHRWKKGQIVSEIELLSEGVNIKDWLDAKLIFGGGFNAENIQGNVSQKKEEVKGDLDNDGVGYTSDDAKIASEVLNVVKKRKKRGG